MAVYPTTVVTTATLVPIVATELTNSPSHTGQHNNLNGEVIAIETALGINPVRTYASLSAALLSTGLSGITWVAGLTSAASAYVVAPFAGTVTGWICQGGAAPAVPGLATVTVGSAGAILLTATIASAGSNGLVTTFTNTSGTTTIAAGASMLINLAASGTAFQQSVTLAIARTA